LYRRALAIDKQSYGPEHPDVAFNLNGLAELLQATRRLDEAAPLYRRALQILILFQRRTGHEHPKGCLVRNSYLDLLQAMGKTPEEVDQSMRELEGSGGPEGS
jgi:hypothetical protein